MQVRRIAVAPCLGLVLLMVPALAQAQYQLTNLVSNQLDKHATTTDPLLVNAWGLARSAGSPWWISDNQSGWSTLYNAAGTQIALRVVIPTAGNGPVEATGANGFGTPTGIVANASKTDFLVSGAASSFIFATGDGTISAWPGLNKIAMGLGRTGLYREQPDRDVTDYYSAIVQFENGVIVNILHSLVSPSPRWTTGTAPSTTNTRASSARAPAWTSTPDHILSQRAGTAGPSRLYCQGRYRRYTALYGGLH